MPKTREVYRVYAVVERMELDEDDEVVPDSRSEEFDTGSLYETDRYEDAVEYADSLVCDRGGS